eukprot:m.26437 g.26437  ORF g.26437 m.26437 type:complete len:308 (+) comp8830_c0_seq1:264-1187(+)
MAWLAWFSVTCVLLVHCTPGDVAAMNVTQDMVFVIGTPKSGTTALCSVLAASPQVVKPQIQPWEAGFHLKEAHYFNKVELEEMTPIKVKTNVSAYLRRFTASESGWQQGYSKGLDCTPQYFSAPQVPSRLKLAFPDSYHKMRFVVLLREPVARTLSHWKHLAKLGYQQQLGSFESMLKAIARTSNFHKVPVYDGGEVALSTSFIQRPLWDSLYDLHMHQWLHDGFSLSQFLLLPLEAFQDDKHSVIARISEFVGLEPGPWQDHVAKQYFTGEPEQVDVPSGANIDQLKQVFDKQLLYNLVLHRMHQR